MTASTKSALTLGGLLLLTVLGAVWGWHAFTKPFPQEAEPAVCHDVTINAGSELRPREVTVSVYNASNRVGLASRTMDALKDKGFGVGHTGNAPAGTRVANVQIWTTDASAPDVALVRSYLGKGATVENRVPMGAGVTVVVGARFDALSKGRQFVVAKDDAVVCRPAGDLS